MSTLGSWDFWKKRLARLLVGLGLALLVSQWLPALPQDQEVHYQAPSGYFIEALELRYVSESDAEVLVSAELHPSTRSRSVLHPLRLANGDYRLVGRAQLVPEGGGEAKDELSAQWHSGLKFEGHAVKLSIPEPSRE